MVKKSAFNPSEKINVKNLDCGSREGASLFVRARGVDRAYLAIYGRK